MQLTDPTPKQTEYNGTVFQSKSEAVLARCFDVAGRNWTYHPTTSDAHEWDFSVEGFMNIAYVEYKPTRPSTTFIRNLDVSHSMFKANDALIIWGSPWNGIQGDADCCYQVIDLTGRNDNTYISGWFGITEDVAQKARRHWFDLASETVQEPTVYYQQIADSVRKLVIDQLNFDRLWKENRHDKEYAFSYLDLELSACRRIEIERLRILEDIDTNLRQAHYDD